MEAEVEVLAPPAGTTPPEGTAPPSAPEGGREVDVEAESTGRLGRVAQLLRDFLSSARDATEIFNRVMGRPGLTRLGGRAVREQRTDVFQTGGEIQLTMTPYGVRMVGEGGRLQRLPAMVSVRGTPQGSFLVTRQGIFPIRPDGPNSGRVTIPSTLFTGPTGPTGPGIVPPTGPGPGPTRPETIPPAIATRETPASAQEVHDALSALQVNGQPVGRERIGNTPDEVASFLLRMNIHPREREMIARMQRAAADLQADLQTRAARDPAWRSAIDSGQVQYVCDGVRVWAVGPNINAFATGGQVLFYGGARTQPRIGEMRQVETAGGVQVQWQTAADGHFYYRDLGGRYVQVFERVSGDRTIAVRQGSIVPVTPGAALPPLQSISFYSEDGSLVTRGLVDGAPIPQSGRVDANFVAGQRGTALRTPDGQALGPASQVIRQIGFQGLLQRLRTLPMPAVMAYITSNMMKQGIDPYNDRQYFSSANLAFDRSQNPVERALLEGKGDCKHAAWMAAAVLRLKGFNTGVVGTERDHAEAITIVRSGGGFKALSFDFVGTRYDLPVCPTPRAALLSAYDPAWRANIESTGRAIVINPNMSEGEAPIDQVANQMITG